MNYIANFRAWIEWTQLKLHVGHVYTHAKWRENSHLAAHKWSLYVVESHIKATKICIQMTLIYVLYVIVSAYINCLRRHARPTIRLRKIYIYIRPKAYTLYLLLVTLILGRKMESTLFSKIHREKIAGEFSCIICEFFVVSVVCRINLIST